MQIRYGIGTFNFYDDMNVCTSICRKEIEPIMSEIQLTLLSCIILPAF